MSRAHHQWWDRLRPPDVPTPEPLECRDIAYQLRVWEDIKTTSNCIERLVQDMIFNNRDVAPILIAANTSRLLQTELLSVSMDRLPIIWKSVESYRILLYELQVSIKKTDVKGACTLAEKMDNLMNELKSYQIASLDIGYPSQPNATAPSSISHMFQNARGLTVYGGNFFNNVPDARLDEILRLQYSLIVVLF